MNQTIKVQFINGASVRSVIEYGFDVATEQPLTFHAYSDQMKARVLETMIKSTGKVGISFTDESPRTGEWHEPLVENAIFNR
jgi:hypothetical protein